MSTQDLVLMLQQRELPLEVIAKRARIRKDFAQRIISNFNEEGLNEHISKGHFTIYQLPAGVPRYDIEGARHNNISLNEAADHICGLMERDDFSICREIYDDSPKKT